MKKLAALLIFLNTIALIIPINVSAGPKSTNYEFKDYSFGESGGVSKTSNYSMFEVGGQGLQGYGKTTNYQLGEGLSYTLKANVPAAPTVANTASNYDRLQITLNPGTNPTDYTYALQISTDNFVNDIRYVKSDFTKGTTLASTDYLKYSSGSPNWGGASGFNVTGLGPGTTYYVRAKAKQGDFTDSEYGPAGSATTNDPTLTFGVDSQTVTFDNLTPGNSYTDSAKSNVLTTSTNAYNGYTIYAKVSQALTAGTATIANYGSPNSAPTTWSGTGFGYTTNDSSLAGGTANRFTSGGPKYAGFSTSSLDPVADHTAAVTTPLSSEQFTISYRVTGSTTTAAGQYSNTIMYIVTPSY